MPRQGLKRPRLAALIMVLAGGIAVASCTTATPYQPAVGIGQNRTGYWDGNHQHHSYIVRNGHHGYWWNHVWIIVD